MREKLIAWTRANPVWAAVLNVVGVLLVIALILALWGGGWFAHVLWVVHKISGR